MEFGRITDDEIARLRARIGQPYTFGQPYNEVASKDVIRHFAVGIGDDNPLWQDEEYARKTRYQSIIAPPLFVNTMGGGTLAGNPGLPGVQGLHTNETWWFMEPIRAGDPIAHECRVIDISERTGRFSDRQVIQVVETTWRRPDGDVVARLHCTNIRFERSEAREKGKYQARTRHHYTPEEIADIDQQILREERRGSNPRYWEDVDVGDDLPAVVKGPVTVTDIIGFARGWGGPFIRPHRFGVLFRQRHPGFGIPNSYGIPDIPERVHWEDELAQAAGFPAPFDYGPQRLAWLCHTLTNWMGDEGWVKGFSARITRPNLLGDTTWCRGKVVDKSVHDGEYLVRCEVWAEDQRGDKTAEFTEATVMLPSRAGGPVRFPTNR